jgi:hypothetical protein
MEYLILHHHVLYTDCTNISIFITASSRYLNFALSCANSNRPKDTMPMLPSTLQTKEKLVKHLYYYNNYYHYFISSYRSLQNDNGLVKKDILTEITKPLN